VRPSGKVHSYLPPSAVGEAMSRLLEHVNESIANVDNCDPERHPLTLATYFHQQFLNVIHPFSDGNGRIARIVMNILLMKFGYPPIFIAEVNRHLYFEAFELSDIDDSVMLDFMCDRMLESLDTELQYRSGQEGVI
jgi:Fic family protein